MKSTKYGAHARTTTNLFTRRSTRLAVCLGLVFGGASCGGDSPSDGSVAAGGGGSASSSSGGVGASGTSDSATTANTTTSGNTASASHGSGGASDSSGTGHAQGSGGVTSGQGGGPPKPPVTACPSIGTGGSTATKWEEVTPSELNSAKWCTPQWNSSCPGPGDIASNGDLATYGALGIVLDPNDTATVYFGTSSLGIWKSKDCGATWVHINTGKNGAGLDKGRNWSMVIDPVDSNVLYTCAGYGESGVFKTTNGGVDWEQILTGSVTASLHEGGFVEKIAMDPTNHEHLTVSFHGPCKQGATEYGCLAESMDAGATWSLIKSAETWTEGDGQTMIDAKLWFFGSLFGGIWRTTDAGQSWTQVSHDYASGNVYVAADGSFYSAGQSGVLHSKDGVTWAKIPGSPSGVSINGSGALVGNATTLFTTNGNGGSEPADGWYWSAPVGDSSKWTTMHGPAMKQGGSYLAYDPDHHLLYSGNLVGGFWRAVAE